MDMCIACSVNSIITNVIHLITNGITNYLPSSSIMVSITLDDTPKVTSFLGTSSTPNVSSDSSVASSMNTNEASASV